MKTILLLSDTHSFADTSLEKHYKHVDEIWHAGDIGVLDVTDYLKSFATLRAVYGNIDDQEIRSEFPKDLFFEIEGFKVWITHIGGYPPKYSKKIISTLNIEKPSIFICGHSHILKVIFDKERQCLHLNPGAIGKHGFHNVRTMLKFKLDKGNISDMKILEYPR